MKITSGGRAPSLSRSAGLLDLPARAPLVCDDDCRWCAAAASAAGAAAAHLYWPGGRERARRPRRSSSWVIWRGARTTGRRLAGRPDFAPGSASTADSGARDSDDRYLAAARDSTRTEPACGAVGSRKPTAPRCRRRQGRTVRPTMVICQRVTRGGRRRGSGTSPDKAPLSQPRCFRSGGADGIKPTTRWCCPRGFLGTTGAQPFMLDSGKRTTARSGISNARL